jgi:hypothetical protein
MKCEFHVSVPYLNETFSLRQTQRVSVKMRAGLLVELSLEYVDKIQ